MRAVIGSIIVVLSTLLAACDDEAEATDPGDVVQARLDDQFRKGEKATVFLPTGRLLITSTDPVGSAGDDETRSRVKIDAPAGTVLVPITWQYDPWTSDRLEGFFAATDNPVIDLASDGESYRLPPPDRETNAAESFYVVVDGDGEDRSLEIAFDGVSQSVDLTTGAVDQGDAEDLYDIEDTRFRSRSCDNEKWFDSGKTADEFTCDLVGPVLTPYAGGEWAPPGSLWMAMTVTTNFSAYGETDLLGGGARYTANRVKVKAEIDGDNPVALLSAGVDANECPVPATAACGWSKHLIFKVPADDGEQGPLDLELEYRLVLASTFGTYDAPQRQTIDATETFKLWDD